MATETDRITLVQTDALVKITEMDHIVLRNKDVETSLRFYVEVLGLKPERVEQWLAGEVRFPSARLNDDTIIDFFGSDQEPTGKDGAKNQDPLLHGYRAHRYGGAQVQVRGLGSRDSSGARQALGFPRQRDLPLRLRPRRQRCRAALLLGKFALAPPLPYDRLLCSREEGPKSHRCSGQLRWRFCSREEGPASLPANADGWRPHR